MEFDDLIPSEQKPAQSKSLNFDDLVPGVEAKEDKPFHERVKERYGERMQQLDERNALIPKTKEERGQKSSPFVFLSPFGDYEKVLNPLAAGAGVALDTVTEGISSLTPDAVGDHLKEDLRLSWDAVKDTAPVKAGMKAISKGADWWEGYKKDNPSGAADIEAALTVGLIAAPVKTKPRGETSLGKTGERLVEKGKDKSLAKRSDFIHDLILPKKTPNVNADLARRTEVTGLTKTKKVIPNKRELEIISEVNKIPGVRKGNLVQENLNAILDVARKEGERLKVLIKAHDKDINMPTVSRELDAAGKRLIEEPELVGDAVMTSQKLLNKAKEIVSKNDSSLSGLLQARKDFDAYILNRRPTALDPKTENAMSASVREIRNTLNGFIEQRVPDGKFKESLRKQNNLLTAADNIAPKAYLQKNTAIERTMQKLSKIGTFREKMGVTLYLATLGGSAFTLPALTPYIAAGGAAYGVGKGITSAAATQARGEIIKAMDDLIPRTTDAKALKELRADRAVLVSAFEEMSSEAEGDPNNKEDKYQAN
jgi:hypothetical protein